VEIRARFREGPILTVPLRQQDCLPYVILLLSTASRMKQFSLLLLFICSVYGASRDAERGAELP
jgi:hypothetical protein